MSLIFSQIRLFIAFILLRLFVGNPCQAQVVAKTGHLGMNPINNGKLGMEWVKKSKQDFRLNTSAVYLGTGFIASEMDVNYGFSWFFGTMYQRANRYRGMHVGGSININNVGFGLGPFLGYRNLAIKESRWGYQAGLNLLLGMVSYGDYIDAFIIPGPYLGVTYRFTRWKED